MLPWLDAARLEADIEAAIRRRRPEAVITFDEDGLYGHPDHVAVHERTTAVVEALDDPAPALYYVTMPPGAMRAVVDHATRRVRDPTVGAMPGVARRQGSGRGPREDGSGHPPSVAPPAWLNVDPRRGRSGRVRGGSPRTDAGRRRRRVRRGQAGGARLPRDAVPGRRAGRHRAGGSPPPARCRALPPGPRGGDRSELPGCVRGPGRHGRRRIAVAPLRPRARGGDGAGRLRRPTPPCCARPSTCSAAPSAAPGWRSSTTPSGPAPGAGSTPACSAASAARFPIVGGIPVLIADAPTRDAMHALEAGHPADALHRLLGLDESRREEFRPPDRRPAVRHVPRSPGRPLPGRGGRLLPVPPVGPHVPDYRGAPRRAGAGPAGRGRTCPGPLRRLRTPVARPCSGRRHGAPSCSRTSTSGSCGSRRESSLPDARRSVATPTARCRSRTASSPPCS